VNSFESKVLLRGAESDGVVAIAESTAPPGWPGPPLQRHDFDQGFYVLDGELTFQLGDELLTAGQGQFAFAKAGAVHTLANRSEAPARYLLVGTPGGFEQEPHSETTVVGPRMGERRDLAPARRIPEGAPARVNVLVRGADSAGRVALMDNVVAAGFGGPPLHYHAFDEAFYVVDGELTFQLGDDLVRRRAGELAFAKRGVHHTFANLSEADARTLIVCTPAGFERYFQRMAATEAGVEPPPEALEPWPEVVKVGPPIALHRP
jgi:quercetin dioxygenase-like cupin family protein